MMKIASEKLAKNVKTLFVVEKDQKSDRGIAQYVEIALVGDQITFETEILDLFDVKGCRPLHYDLLLLCAAIEYADRRWKRPQGWRRDLHLIVPVTDLRVWQNLDVQKSLKRALNHLTCDTWEFTFVEAKNLSPIGSRQIPLDFEKTKTFAVPYSDGMDSRAVSALSGKKDEVLCIRVSGKRQKRKEGDSYFTQIPFKVLGHKSNESSFRTRGFQFSIVTAIAAQLSNVKRIVVPESGQGALGPVLLPLYNIYPDYRNHPVFFRNVEKFLRLIQGSDISFDQPRLWFTKGQTLSEFLKLPGKTHRDLTDTHSCWQRRWVVNVGVRRHCGLCAACLLRRVSLKAAGVEEAPSAYVISDLSNGDLRKALSAIPREVDRRLMVEYGSIGARHLQHLADSAGLSDDELRVHASELALATGATLKETLKNLRSLLVRHAEEWRAFLSAQGEESFLMRWLDGGRFG